jgi:hypothetical protein
LLAQRRRRRKRRLTQANSIISAIVAAEFPLTGIRWQRIAGACDLLKQVLAEEADRDRSSIEADRSAPFRFWELFCLHAVYSITSKLRMGDGR